MFIWVEYGFVPAYNLGVGLYAHHKSVSPTPEALKRDGSRAASPGNPIRRTMSAAQTPTPAQQTGQPHRRHGMQAGRTRDGDLGAGPAWDLFITIVVRIFALLVLYI